MKSLPQINFFGMISYQKNVPISKKFQIYHFIILENVQKLPRLLIGGAVRSIINDVNPRIPLLTTFSTVFYHQRNTYKILTYMVTRNSNSFDCLIVLIRKCFLRKSSNIVIIQSQDFELWKVSKCIFRNASFQGYHFQIQLILFVSKRSDSQFMNMIVSRPDSIICQKQTLQFWRIESI